jgi:uncharacterized alkaline shock family protein YloU
MKLYAFVGASGTGKSYQSLSLCKKMNINYLIDDGILIHGQKKIEGSSAKREHTKVGAVKRAIFFWQEARDQMKETLIRENPEALLIIGTSIKMVQQIAENLGIDPIDELIFIEDVCSKENIAAAKDSRMKYGQHVIPLPTVEVKKDFSGYFLDTLKIFTRVFGKKDEIIEKSVVRPTFSFMGKFTISNRTLHQIIMVSLSQVSGVYESERIKVSKSLDQLTLEIDLCLTFGVHLNQVGQKALEKVKSDLEWMTQLQVVDVRIRVKNIHYK